MYFFGSQITAIINKIEKNTQREHNFIFYEFSEYVNFFCFKMFPQFRGNDVACDCSPWKAMGKFTLLEMI